MKLLLLAQLSLLGGQYFLEGDAASVGGRADAFVSPVLKLSESHEIVPVYSGSYSGTQDIQELAGGGVLTRQRQSHTASLAYKFRREFDTFSPRLSYTKGLTQETRDEKWGKGLFDTETLSVGVSGEHERWWGSVSESYDFYGVKYPNYDSLLSQSSVALDSTTFAELAQNSGSAVLDNVNHRLAVAASLHRGPLTYRAGYDGTYRSYPDQAVVGSAGQFKSSKRSDLIQNLTLRVARDLKPLAVGLSGRVGLLGSNQNSYDASRTQYIGDYYDYTEFALTPSALLVLKNRATLQFETGWTQRLYGGRLAQSADGAYSDSRVRQTQWLTSLNLRVPVAVKGLYLRAAMSYQSSSSNMKYEANYRYNYQANNYLLGLEWEL